MEKRTFHDVDVDGILRIKGKKEYGVSVAVTKGDITETYCSGSARFGKEHPINTDMIFQAGSVSKPVFAMTLLKFVDKKVIDLDADLSDVISDLIKGPVTFEALLSHSAGLNVHGFPGYRADSDLLSLEDVLSGRGNTPRIRRIKKYKKEFCYSGGGITLAELAFTRITGKTLPEAFDEEIAKPLNLVNSGYFQPLDENRISNAAFGGKLGIKENKDKGYHYYPEHAAAGFWTTPTELNRIGIELGISYRKGGLISKESAKRMMKPVIANCGLCIFRGDDSAPELAYHGGWNEGFLTDFRFSLKDRLCVTAMTNRANMKTASEIGQVGERLYKAFK